MFDSLEEQMKARDMEGSPKEKLVRYVVIIAISIVVVAAIFAVVTFVK
jgi:t-SNARE complex subunit (syntaxin)